MMRATLGIDIGGSKLLAVVISPAGIPEAWTRRHTGRDFSPAVAVPLISALIAELAERGQPIGSVGIGFPGLVDSVRGVTLSSVMIRGWDRFPVVSCIADATGLPCTIDNDAKNAARAELHARAFESKDMLFVTVGTGIGGAVVLNGHIWRGEAGLAGEIGHVTVAKTADRCCCGRSGCVNLLASGPAIERRLRLRRGSLLGGAVKRNGQMRSAVRQGAAALGVAIASVLNVLNLPLVVLAGGVAELGEAYREAVESAARRETFPEVAGDCRFELSRCGYSAGALGAALLAGGALDAPVAPLPELWQ